MTVPSEVFAGNNEILNRSILAAYRGSIAHGMYVPPKEPTSIDDKDLMYVVVPTIEYYLGLKEWGSRGTKEIMKDSWNIVAYEVRKFVSLLAQGNPNVITMLWLEPNYYIKIANSGKLLIQNRGLFVGKHSYKAFNGYAHGQLHRMTHHAFQGHMGEKRKQLVEKFGYDTKNAAHLIRLLRMNVEFLSTGELQVLRKDATQLLEIKKGEWSLENVLKEADFLFKKSLEAYSNSTLPEYPDYEKINRLCVDVVKTALMEVK